MEPEISARDNLTVVALGGNAIIAKGERGTISQQFANVRRTLRPIVALMQQGHNFILTHGNGPQVGNLLVQNELASAEVPDLPLGVLDAMTCGSMGYMIAQCLQNVMIDAGTWRDVVTLPIQVVVDRNDPAMADPSKPIGPFYDRQQAQQLSRERGWIVKEDAGRGWRRYVASPRPIDIIEKDAIASLLDKQYTVVTAGGGGIPVEYDRDGTIEGVDCVIDKDLSSAKLALTVGARRLLIITGVPQVTLNYGSQDERPLGTIGVTEARSYYDQGQFPAGSMGPKMLAAIEFAAAHRENRVIITNEASLLDAFAGKAGTHIVADER